MNRRRALPRQAFVALAWAMLAVFGAAMLVPAGVCARAWAAAGPADCCRKSAATHHVHGGPTTVHDCGDDDGPDAVPASAPCARVSGDNLAAAAPGGSAGISDAAADVAVSPGFPAFGRPPASSAGFAHVLASVRMGPSPGARLVLRV